MSAPRLWDRTAPRAPHGPTTSNVSALINELSDRSLHVGFVPNGVPRRWGHCTNHQNRDFPTTQGPSGPVEYQRRPTHADTRSSLRSPFVICHSRTMDQSRDFIVSRMSTASARLAWASTAPGASTIKIQSALANELTTTAENGWDQLQSGDNILFNESASYRELQ